MAFEQIPRVVAMSPDRLEASVHESEGEGEEEEDAWELNATSPPESLPAPQIGLFHHLKTFV